MHGCISAATVKFIYASVRRREGNMSLASFSKLYLDRLSSISTLISSGVPQGSMLGPDSFLDRPHRNLFSHPPTPYLSTEHT